jgi:DNA-directed RNA polymerase specialized sigma24 family protein
MDRNQALDQLPETYATALRLDDQGHDNQAIGARLGLPAEAVPQLLRLATAKLRNLLAANENCT